MTAQLSYLSVLYLDFFSNSYFAFKIKFYLTLKFDLWNELSMMLFTLIIGTDSQKSKFESSSVSSTICIIMEKTLTLSQS